MLEELRSSSLLSNWGGVSGLSGEVEERCFLPARDVAVPGTLKESTVRRSPWLLEEAPLRRQLGARETQLYFFGALCWKTDKVRVRVRVRVRVKVRVRVRGEVGLIYRLFSRRGSGGTV